MSYSHDYVMSDGDVCRTTTRRITDPCEVCNLSEIKESCNKCGTGVCTGSACALLFPHHGGTTFSVCIWCADVIRKKLTLYIDIDKLRLLKKRIRDGSSPRQMRASSSADDEPIGHGV